MNKLESNLNKINLALRFQGVAYIEKKETPIAVTNKGVVAKFSTVDYIGLLNTGKYIAFDAKETKNKTSFPLANIKQHQINFLKLINELNGISFFLVHFTEIHTDKVFIVPIEFIVDFINTNNRKSIPFKSFKKEWLTDLNDYIDKVKEVFKC